MKLFILAALIAVSSAARLEHLEQQRGLKEYLPPFQAGQQNSFGSNGFSQGSNSLDADSTGFGSAPQGQRASAAGTHGFSSFEAARSNQYLPPDHGPSGNHGGAHGQDSFGASSNQFGSQSQFGQNNKFGARGPSSFGSQGSNGFPSQGAHGFGAQGSNGFGSQGSNGFGSQSNGFGTHGSNAFGSHGSQGSGFSSQSSNGFGSQGNGGSQGSNSFGSQGSRSQQNLRQYLAPKSSHDNVPQQAFDEQSGYIY